MTAVRMAATNASGMPSKPAASAASNQNSAPVCAFTDLGREGDERIARLQRVDYLVEGVPSAAERGGSKVRPLG